MTITDKTNEPIKKKFVDPLLQGEANLRIIIKTYSIIVYTYIILSSNSKKYLVMNNDLCDGLYLYYDLSAVAAVVFAYL